MFQNVSKGQGSVPGGIICMLLMSRVSVLSTASHILLSLARVGMMLKTHVFRIYIVGMDVIATYL